jgi:hypothetical protein
MNESNLQLQIEAAEAYEALFVPALVFSETRDERCVRCFAS